jgi:hypothetical protein
MSFGTVFLDNLLTRCCAMIVRGGRMAFREAFVVSTLKLFVAAFSTAECQLAIALV